MIRRATIEDAAAIARIHVETWRTAYAGIVPADYLAGLSVEQRTVWWQQQLTDSQTVILVAMEDGEMAGWASGGACRDPDARGEAEVYAIYVTKKYWGKHIGRQLMAELEAKLPMSATISLWVLRENQRAVRFY